MTEQEKKDIRRIVNLNTGTSFKTGRVGSLPQRIYNLWTKLKVEFGT